MNNYQNLYLKDLICICCTVSIFHKVCAVVLVDISDYLKTSFVNLIDVRITFWGKEYYFGFTLATSMCGKRILRTFQVLW